MIQKTITKCKYYIGENKVLYLSYIGNSNEKWKRFKQYGILLKTMMQKSNILLEYTIDNLLKIFNPDRKPIMNRSHFFKMMDILDTNLQKQAIDIGYPKYWYKYGSVAHMGVLEQSIAKGFSRYMMGDNIVSPYPCRKTYNVDDQQKSLIISNIKRITKKYRFKRGYGNLLKKDSYIMNSPYKFNTLFQKYFEPIQSLSNIKQLGLLSAHDNLEPLLDKLFDEFPENNYSELLDIHLAWDDTTRLVIDYISDQREASAYLGGLTELFWGVYSKAIRINHNQNIPQQIIQDWEHQYKMSIVPVYVEIENIREKIIMGHNFNIDTEDNLVKDLLQKTYFHM